MANPPTLRRIKTKEAQDALTQELMADIVDAQGLAPELSKLRAKFEVDGGELEVSVYVYLCNADGQGNDFRVWESNDPDTYDLKSIARSFGSGRYRLRVYAGASDSTKPCVINRVQGVLLTPAEDAKIAAAKEAIKNPQVAPVHNGTEMRELMREMMDGFQQTVAKLIPAQPAVVDPLAQFEKMASVMKSMMPTAPAPSEPGLEKFLGMMKTFKELTGGEGASASEALMMKAADAFMPAIAEGLKAKPSPAAAAPGAPGPAQIATELSEEEQMFNLKQQTKLIMFQLQLKAANKAAARGIAADAYAITIYDAFEEDDIQGIALSSNWFDLMCQTVPDCKANEAWFFNVRTALIELAVEDGILLRDAAGALTLPPEEGTSDDSLESKSPNGTADAR
jgi:hypothetical protein